MVDLVVVAGLEWGINVWDENWGRWIVDAPVFQRL